MDETTQAWNAFCLYRDYGATGGFMKAIEQILNLNYLRQRQFFVEKVDHRIM